MRKFSSLASRVVPSIPNPPQTLNNSIKPTLSRPPNPTPRASSSTGKHSNSAALSIPRASFSQSKPIDHRYFAEILSRKDWNLLLNHELKAQNLVLNPQVVVSILQNQEKNPLCFLRFYIWVSAFDSSLAKNQSVRSALSNVLYRQGPVLLSGELVGDVTGSGFRISEDLLCILIGSWGRLGLARYCAEVFDQISYLGISPTTRLYNAVIDGLVKANSLDLAYLKFQQMEGDNCVPDRFTYNTLIHGVCKAGVVDEAIRLVKQMEGLGYSPNVFTYTMLIDGYCNVKRFDGAFGVLDKMKTRNIRPNDVTYRSLVNGIFRSVTLEEAFESLSRWMKQEPKLPKVVYDSVLFRLCNSSLHKYAAELFMTAEGKGYVPDAPTSNILMTCLIGGLDLNGACQIFDTLIKRKVVMDLNVCLSLLEALYGRGRETKANQYFSWIVQAGLVSNVYAYNMVIDCFCKVKLMDRALVALGEMSKRGILPNLVTYNTLIAGYCRVRDVVKAREMLLMLLNHGFKPDIFTFGSIIDLLCLVNQIDDAFDSFLEMVEWGITPNSVVYNSLIRSLCIYGDVTKAMKLLRKMQVGGMQADVQSFNSLIQKYCKVNKIDWAQSLLVSMLALDLRPDNISFNAFISALCESGRYEEAKEVFLSMEAGGCAPDTFTCNSFIGSLVRSGRSREAEAVWLTCKSKGVPLNAVPIVSGASVG